MPLLERFGHYASWEEGGMSRQRGRILIVDDEPDMCWVIENALPPTDYAVKTVSRAIEALELLAVESYDVALVDAKLPDIDGVELAAVIHSESPNTTVILISGYHHLEDSTIVEGLRDHLFAGFVPKPFDIKDIREVIRQAMQRNRNQ
jgi:DNA-binding NtrC family response regulator